MAAKQIQEGLAALFGLASGKGRPVPYVTPPDPSARGIEGGARSRGSSERRGWFRVTSG
jgi:hypothetical protein